MRPGKRGQITLFIVIVVLVLLAAYAIMTSQRQASRRSAQESLPATQIPTLEPESIRLSMQDCYDTLARMDLLYFGLTGTYPDFKHANTGDPSYLTILYDRGSKSVNPSPEQTISRYLDSLLPLCVDGEGFRLRGIELSAETPKTKVLLRERDVMFQTEYPVTARAGGQTVTTTGLSTSVPVRLSYLLQVTRTLVDSTHADPDYFNLTLMSSFDLNVTAAMVGKDTAGYVITDEKSRVARDAPYELIFAVRT